VLPRFHAGWPLKDFFDAIRHAIVQGVAVLLSLMPWKFEPPLQKTRQPPAI